MVSSKSSSSVTFETKKIFLNFDFFRGVIEVKVLCEHVVFSMILFTFWGIFVKIKDFFYKNSNLKLYFTQQMNQFCVPNRRKAIKRLVLVSQGSLLSKKFEL